MAGLHCVGISIKSRIFGAQVKSGTETGTKMDQKRNYQRELEKILCGLDTSDAQPPRLLLHSCCAPCSSYCMEYLREYFQLTVFYYNPNITQRAEYEKRVQEEIRLIEAYNQRGRKIEVIEGDYDPDRFLDMAAGLEHCAEGGERCFGCYALRLQRTAKLAGEMGFDYFTTTLTISPLKNAVKLNEIGEGLSKEYGVRWLPSDFKKRGGYKRSIELSREYGLYRQNYCGCEFSKRRAETDRPQR